MSYVAKSVLRQAKNVTKGYTDIQAKVREATSNDPWGPSSSIMAEIAEFSYNHASLIEIMGILDKRLNDHGKNWRHVFKSLLLLDYLIHSGSENVISYAKDNLYIIKTLKEFQYIDEEGKDQGVNIRQKSKEITNLLEDDERLKKERTARTAMRERINLGGGSSGSFRESFDSSSVRVPQSEEQEQRDLQRALEESKRTAAEHEEKMKAYQMQRQKFMGAGDDVNSPSINSMSSPAPQAVDLLSLDFDSNQHNQQNQQHQQNEVVFDPFATGYNQNSNNNPFQQQQQQQINNNPFGAHNNDPFSSNNNNYQQNGMFQQNNVPFQQQQNNINNNPFHQQQQPQFNNNPFSLTPNAQLAQIARNAPQIDPFASISSSNTTPFSNNNNNNNVLLPQGQMMNSLNQQQQQQQSSSPADPFADLVVVPKNSAPVKGYNTPPVNASGNPFAVNPAASNDGRTLQEISMQQRNNAMITLAGNNNSNNNSMMGFNNNNGINPGQFNAFNSPIKNNNSMQFQGVGNNNFNATANPNAMFQQPQPNNTMRNNNNNNNPFY